MDADKMRRTAARVVELVVQGDHKGLEVLSGSLRLDAARIREALGEYPGRLAPPPEGWLDALTCPEDAAVLSRSGISPQYFLDIRLWDEELPPPRPELVLELLLFDAPGPLCAVEIQDIYTETPPE